MVTFKYPVLFKLGLLKEAKDLKRDTYYHDIALSSCNSWTMLCQCLLNQIQSEALFVNYIILFSQWWFGDHNDTTVWIIQMRHLESERSLGGSTHLTGTRAWVGNCGHQTIPRLIWHFVSEMAWNLNMWQCLDLQLRLRDLQTLPQVSAVYLFVRLWHLHVFTQNRYLWF